VAALLIAVVVGVPLGVLAGSRHNSRTDVATVVGANLGVSIPVFVLGLILQYIFAKQLNDTPFALPASGQLTAGVIPDPFYEVWGIGENPVFEFIANIDTVNAILIWRWDIFWDAVQHLILPAVALSTIPMAIIARMTRSSLLDVLGLDYVRTARAKGLRERIVIGRHALRNSMLPVVTVIGLSLGTLLGGAILTETIFNLTGVGKTLFDAISGRDYFVVQGFTLAVAFVFVIVNLVTDIVYGVLDPKVRVG
jgi:peptide/nickel transport system permease protein